MKNVTQSIVFPVSSIIPSPIPEDLRDLFNRARTASLLADQVKAANDAAMKDATLTDAQVENETKTRNDAKALADELTAKTSEKMTKELSHFGCKGLLETVTVSMKLGTWLFDLYCLSTPRPEAPLHQHIWNKRNMELADTVDKDEFELPAWSVPAIRRGLLDDETWKNANLSAWVEVASDKEGEAPLKRFFTMRSMGAQFFGKIMEAAAEALYTDDLLKTVK
jgi:hypothetical protein